MTRGRAYYLCPDGYFLRAGEWNGDMSPESERGYHAQLIARLLKSDSPAAFRMEMEAFNASHYAPVQGMTFYENSLRWARCDDRKYQQYDLATIQKEWDSDYSFFYNADDLPLKFRLVLADGGKRARSVWLPPGCVGVTHFGTDWRVYAASDTVQG